MTTAVRDPFYHGYYDANDLRPDLGPAPEGSTRHFVLVERSLTYDFYLHQHPYVGELLRRLLEDSVEGLQAADTDRVPGQTLPDGTPRPTLYEEFFAQYAPAQIVRDRPVRDLDFTVRGAYSEYNWELFFHVPLTIAIHLSKNGRFEDAQKWFHYVFDPTDATEGPAPAHFWKVRPFQTTSVELIEKILVNLATGDDPQLLADTVDTIHAWKESPFQPHVVARHRPSAYMFKTVMAYLDNLIAWGDSLFRQDTRESINEAAQLYVLAAAILGRQPQEVPNKGRMRAQTYASLQQDLDSFSNALRRLETDVPFELVPMPAPQGGGGQGTPVIASLGNALYFGVPRNDILLGYWRTVADRLFKIRNSLNIRGIFRQLPLFEPPIDPALLARAAAAGLDVAAIVSGANQPLPLVRFSLLVQKATEICQEVKSLGAGVLAAMEKHDGEAFQLLRSQHERTVLELAESVRYGQWQEAIKAREGVERSMANAIARYTYYERQIGKQKTEIKVPEAGAIDAASLVSLKFRANEPEIPLRDIELDIVKAIQGLPGAYPMSSWEAIELAGIIASNLLQVTAGVFDASASALSLVPQFHVRATPWGIGAGGTFGGDQLSKMASSLGSFTRAVSTAASGAASVSAKVGGYARRQQDWEFQSNLAAGEITQLYKQLRASQIREAIAEREWHNHQQQIVNARAIETFLTDPRTGKATNKDFYAWMKREVKGLYSRCFEFAFDVARKAERALQQELGDPSLTFLQFNYIAGNEGLLAGEKLLLDIKRMELAYHELNRREYELTKHVSLRELDPEALLQLRTTGNCTFTVPEELFDLDAPGHYFRRIRSVALTIPSVVGPYTTVNATLTQLRSTIRASAQLSAGNNDYPREGADDPRFIDHFGSLDSVVTSSAQNDAGLFEVNLRDERVLPFEGSGVASQWRLELPSVMQFDPDTIADVIQHFRYTAREGGTALAQKATDHLTALIANAQALGSVRLFSVRHDFPSEWMRFKAATIDGDNPTAALTLTLRPEHYPFWSLGRIGSLRSVDIFARTTKNTVSVSSNGKVDTLVKIKVLGDLRGAPLQQIAPPAPVGPFTLNFDDNSMDELWLTAAWGA